MIRPRLIERPDYVPGLRVEEFMVPLLRSKIVALLESLPGSGGSPSALDVGCGGQPFRGLIERQGYRYVGVDAQDPLGIVDHLVEIDRELPADLVGRGPFDLVLCTEVLEHVADWEKAFSNFSTLLKTHGRLVITCPQFYHLHEVPYDFWRPTVHALQFYADRWGLDAVSIERAGSSWDILGTMLGANIDGATASPRSFVNRVLAYAIDTLTLAAFHLLKTRTLQRRVTWGTDRFPMYLANVALLEKRAS
jgi:SAM-dependent methyltransferase